MSILIRPATLEDAEGYYRILREVDLTREERTFLDDELEQDAALQLSDMEWYLSGTNRTILVAEVEGALAGYATVVGGSYEVDRRTGMLVVEVLAGYRRRGIGEALLRGIENFATECGMHRLELTVLAGNEAALSLYHKCGFTNDGIRRDARWISGKYRDEYWMSKLLPPE